MHIEHILSQTINTPLMVAPAKLTVIMEFLLSRSGGSTGPDLSTLAPRQSSGQAAAAASGARPVHRTMNDTIVVIPALGSMVNRTYGVRADSGLESYRNLSDRISQAVADPTIHGIILDFDSFGGMAAGCERITRVIAAAARQKPIYAVIDLNCFSAAYSLAAACTKIVLTDHSAGVGSIGCIALHYDRSQRNEKEGDVYTAVFFGERKNDFSPHVPLDKEQFRRLRQSVDNFGMQFARTVAELREIDLDAVLDTRAGMFFGRDAIDLGLADEIASFDEASVMLIDEIRTHRRKTITGGFMSTKDRFAVLLKTEEGQKAAIELGFLNTADTNSSEAFRNGYAKGLKEGQQAFNRKISEIAGIAELAKLESRDLLAILRKGINEPGFTGEDATKEVQNILASNSRQKCVANFRWKENVVADLRKGLIDASALSTDRGDDQPTRH